jgi:aminomethyltransferase
VNHGTLKKTALCEIHRQLGARMVDFAGWEMPVQYAGPLKEHMAVRTRAGIFDVSHMGEIEVRGGNALKTIQRVTCNDAERLAVGQVQYSALTTPAGTFIDDILVYRRATDRFLLCVNCSNQDKDYRWILENSLPEAEVRFRSEDFSQLALQGPIASEILQPLTDIDLSSMKYYWFAEGKVADSEAIVSRTGYTGEDGFEIYLPPAHAVDVWNRIYQTGRPLGLEPAGLAARNTLRLEARMALYGNDIDETTTVLEADLGWICRLDKGDFIGREPLLHQRKAGIARKLIGFEMVERGIARDHYPIRKDGEDLGLVTSGSPAPFLQKNIGLAYLPIRLAEIGTEFDIIIRGRPVRARVVQTPFYRRAKAA